MKGLDESVLKLAFGQVLKVLRRGRGNASQEEVAAKGGIDRTSWSLLECGHRAPNLMQIWRIAGALGVPPHELMALTSDMYERVMRESETHAGIVAPLTGTSVRTSDT